MADLSGTWLGTYWQAGLPTRFEVTLLQNGNTLTGNILDDGYLGEASLKGEVVGRRVSFIKQYLTTSPHPIEYTGMVNESEDLIQGQWRIRRYSSGPWEARRSGDNLTLELSQRLGAKIPVTVGPES